MSYANDILAALDENRDAIRAKLSLEAFAEFDDQRRALAQRSLLPVKQDEEALTAEVLALVRRYEPVAEVLRTPAPHVLGEEGARAARFTPLPKTTNAIELTAGAPRQASTAESIGPTPGSISPPLTPPEQPPRAREWTPEVIIQVFKEAVTAIIGLLLVGFTVYLSVRAVNNAGESDKMGDSKDILQVLVGLAGVVIGYYFGRVPADARAVQAQQQAASAVKQADAVMNKGEEMTAEVEKMMLNRQGTPRPDERSAEPLARIMQKTAEMRAIRHA